MPPMMVSTLPPVPPSPLPACLCIAVDSPRLHNCNGRCARCMWLPEHSLCGGRFSPARLTRAIDERPSPCGVVATAGRRAYHGALERLCRLEGLVTRSCHASRLTAACVVEGRIPLPPSIAACLRLTRVLRGPRSGVTAAVSRQHAPSSFRNARATRRRLLASLRVPRIHHRPATNRRLLAGGSRPFMASLTNLGAKDAADRG